MLARGAHSSQEDKKGEKVPDRSEAKRKSSDEPAARTVGPVEGRKIHVGEDDWVQYESHMAAAKALAVDSSKILKCCREEQDTTGGYEFRLAWPYSSNFQFPRKFGTHYRNFRPSKFQNFRPNFQRLVLGCIEATFCK